MSPSSKNLHFLPLFTRQLNCIRYTCLCVQCIVTQLKECKGIISREYLGLLMFFLPQHSSVLDTFSYGCVYNYEVWIKPLVAVVSCQLWRYLIIKWAQYNLIVFDEITIIFLSRLSYRISLLKPSFTYIPHPPQHPFLSSFSPLIHTQGQIMKVVASFYETLLSPALASSLWVEPRDL